MNYTVLWVPAAERELAKLWMDAVYRHEVAVAANQIDARLRIAPAEEGESRGRGRRILLVPPLGVTFEVFPQDRIARVLDVWRFQQRS